jgi:hypothetical protein
MGVRFVLAAGPGQLSARAQRPYHVIVVPGTAKSKTHNCRSLLLASLA